MSILTRMMGAGEQRATLANPVAEWLRDALTGGYESASGEDVNHQTALTLDSYYACRRNIAEDVAKVPFPVFKRRKGRGKDRQPGHRVHEMLNVGPNDEMSSQSFRETLTDHAIDWGNGCAEIIRDRKTGAPVEMHILDPSLSTLERTDAGELRLYYRRGTENERSIPYADVFHIHGLGFDGIRGYSITRMARQSIGAGLAEVKSGAALFGNNCRPGGVLQYPNSMDPKA